MLLLSFGSKSKFSPYDFDAVRPSDVQQRCFFLIPCIQMELKITL